MKALQRMVIIFAASMVAAKVVSMLLKSDAGKQAARSMGLDALLSQEGAETASRYARTATGLLVGTVLTLRSHQADKHSPQDSSMIRTAENTAELALAAGAFAKIVADFLREEQKIRSS